MTFWIPLVSALVFAQPAQPPGARPQQGKGLEPIVLEDLERAQARAQERRLPIVTAIGMGGDAGSIPPLFKLPAMARASRASVVLCALEYFAETPFFRIQRITPERVPCILLMDGLGNVLDRFPATEDAGRLLACARSVQGLVRSIKEELPKVAARAAEHAERGDVGGFLEIARPWLSKRYHGYGEMAQLHELAEKLGWPLVDMPLAVNDVGRGFWLQSVALAFADTRVEARATLELARLLENQQQRGEAKRLLKRIVEEILPSDTDELTLDARAILDAYRREEIRRRLEEQKKREAQEK